MNPCPEVQALAVHALIDLQQRVHHGSDATVTAYEGGHLSLQWQLLVELAPQKHKQQLFELLPTSLTKGEAKKYEVRTSYLAYKFVDAYHLQDSSERLELMCRLGMMEQVAAWELNETTAPLALTAAARGGRLELVKMLLYKLTKLHLGDYILRDCVIVTTRKAIEAGHFDVVWYLSSLVPRETMDYFQSMAAKAGRRPILELFLFSDGPQLEPSMWDAASKGHSELVALLLSRMQGPPKDWERVDSIGNFAVFKLICAAAKPTIKAAQLRTLISRAARQGDIEWFHKLNSLGHAWTMDGIARSIGKGGLVALAELIPNPQERHYWQLLDGAAVKGRPEIIRYVHSRYPQLACVSMVEKAITGGHVEAAAELLSDNDFDQRELSYLLRVAAKYGRLECARVLLGAGAIPTQEARQAALPLYPEVAFLLEGPRE